MCVHVFNVFCHWCTTWPQRCTAWIWSEQHVTVSWLTKKTDQPIYFFVLFLLHSEIDFMLTSSLFHVGVIFIDARHAFYQQSHCVNCNIALLFCWGLSSCKYRFEFEWRKSLEGPRRGFKLKKLYILCIQSSILTCAEDVRRTPQRIKRVKHIDCFLPLLGLTFAVEMKKRKK